SYKYFFRGVELCKIGGRVIYSTCSMNPLENEAVVAAVMQLAEGSLSLINAHNVLPLKSSPGLTTWKVLWNSVWYSNYESLPDKEKKGKKLFSSMFPPEGDLSYLKSCLRLLPHHTNTGGFFVAVIEKKATLPWNTRERPLTHILPSEPVAVHTPQENASLASYNPLIEETTDTILLHSPIDNGKEELSPSSSKGVLQKDFIPLNSLLISTSSPPVTDMHPLWSNVLENYGFTKLSKSEQLDFCSHLMYKPAVDTPPSSTKLMTSPLLSPPAKRLATLLPESKEGGVDTASPHPGEKNAITPLSSTALSLPASDASHGLLFPRKLWYVSEGVKTFLTRCIHHRSPLVVISAGCLLSQVTAEGKYRMQYGTVQSLVPHINFQAGLPPGPQMAFLSRPTFLRLLSAEASTLYRIPMAELCEAETEPELQKQLQELPTNSPVLFIFTDIYDTKEMLTKTCPWRRPTTPLLVPCWKGYVKVELLIGLNTRAVLRWLLEDFTNGRLLKEVPPNLPSSTMLSTEIVSNVSPCEDKEDACLC
ncbi:NOL1/NOP2/sun family protein, partial [Cardiosporidium cionae]